MRLDLTKTTVNVFDHYRRSRGLRRGNWGGGGGGESEGNWMFDTLAMEVSGGEAWTVSWGRANFSPSPSVEKKKKKTVWSLCGRRTVDRSCLVLFWATWPDAGVQHCWPLSVRGDSIKHDQTCLPSTVDLQDWASLVCGAWFQHLRWSCRPWGQNVQICESSRFLRCPSLSVDPTQCWHIQAQATGCVVRQFVFLVEPVFRFRRRRARASLLLQWCCWLNACDQWLILCMFDYRSTEGSHFQSRSYDLIFPPLHVLLQVYGRHLLPIQVIRLDLST